MRSSAPVPRLRANSPHHWSPVVTSLSIEMILQTFPHSPQGGVMLTVRPGPSSALRDGPEHRGPRYPLVRPVHAPIGWHLEESRDNLPTPEPQPLSDAYANGCEELTFAVTQGTTLARQLAVWTPAQAIRELKGSHVIHPPGRSVPKTCHVSSSSILLAPASAPTLLSCWETPTRGF